MKLRNIEILEKDNNKKGDLFGRLMSDLFHTLGYDEPRLNIHKSGREIDLNAYHRTESKIAIAECKAHSDTIGGADINKFVGVVDAEKRKINKDKSFKDYSIVGYFISISGFKETAIEQENEFDNSRVILIKSDKVVEELIRGRIIVSIEKAIASLSSITSDFTILNYVDLLAYEKGWVWTFYFSNSSGQQASHFAFVHAEGKPLIKKLAEGIVAIDNKINKLFNGLSLLNSDVPTEFSKQNLETTRKKYFKYLENELGEIQFEGLPTDKEAGSVKVKLESIFVPLHLSQNQKLRKKEPIEIDSDTDSHTREKIGEILNKKSRLAILAKPGGGKSTLIKRIAIAYAFPERRNQINDILPDKNWFPIFLRCRELGDKVTQSITDIIHNIPSRAEIHSCADDFSILVSSSLQNGTALLLIDGLDEIAEDKNRIAFVNQLRTFIATYPSLNIIVTSREAGFRVIGGSLASYCENYTIANLIHSEIEELCLKWHKAIIDDSENTIKEANKLSDLILKDSRIKVLAENPLLLTTLLFVKRWAGYLPTKRSVLYQEMIKLLLVTWNVEGHEILDIEEAEPQLAFVAYWMTKNGQQTITSEELNKCLIDARKQMPEILGYTKVNPSEFIKRVESRSSLLILSGHKRLESGSLTAVYEFLHLSFQEYLTAKAIVKRFIPQSEIENKVVDIIKPNINNENWKEVVPLTAVLLEREAKDLVEYLIQQSKIIVTKPRGEILREESIAPSLLGSCLANEIQINPVLLGTAIEWYAKSNPTLPGVQRNTETILNSKFGIEYRKKVKSIFFETYEDIFAPQLGWAIGEIFIHDSPKNKAEFYQSVSTSLAGNSNEDKCLAIMGLTEFVFGNMNKDENENEDEMDALINSICNIYEINNLHLNFSISWCVAWTGSRGVFPERISDNFLIKMISSWINSSNYNLRRQNSWALYAILQPFIKKELIEKIPKLISTIDERISKNENEYDKIVALFLGTIVNKTFDTSVATEILNSSLNRRKRLANPNSSISQFARALNIELKSD